MRRGSNAHLGRTCFMVLRRADVVEICAIVRQAGRCLVDVVRLALRHFDYRPERYAGLRAPPKHDRHRIYLRLGRRLVDSLADAAWEAGQPVTYWLGGVVVRFLRLADRARLIAKLRAGADLDRLLEI